MGQKYEASTEITAHGRSMSEEDYQDELIWASDFSINPDGISIFPGDTGMAPQVLRINYSPESRIRVKPAGNVLTALLKAF